jgi:hypothetical protein
MFLYCTVLTNIFNTNTYKLIIRPKIISSRRSLGNYTVWIFSLRFSAYFWRFIFWGKSKPVNVTRFGVGDNFCYLLNVARTGRKTAFKPARE